MAAAGGSGGAGSEDPGWNLRGLESEKREERLKRLAQEEVSRRFDLGRDMMLRVTLIRLGEQEHAVLFTQHHIASDGWLIGILVKELRALYGAYAEGKGGPLPELRIQTGDYAEWQRGWADGGGAAGGSGGWRSSRKVGLGTWIAAGQGASGEAGI